MATAQKRGFRFPWGNDGRRDTPESTDQDDVHEQTLAERIGAVPDDLGRGPFDLQNTAVAEPPSADTWDPVGNEPQDEPNAAAEASATDAAPAEVQTDQVAATAAAPAPEPAPAPEAARPEAVAPAPPQPPAKSAAAPAPSAWPESDRRTNCPAINVAPPAPVAPAAPKRDNKLMTGLVRAMRDAAKVARDEAVAALRSDATERGAAIRAQSVAATASLRRGADGDVAATPRVVQGRDRPRPRRDRGTDRCPEGQARG